VYEEKIKENSTYFYYTFSGGFEFAIAQNLCIDVSARYVGTNSQKFGEVTGVTLELYGIFAGLTFNF